MVWNRGRFMTGRMGGGGFWVLAVSPGRVSQDRRPWVSSGEDVKGLK